MRCDFQKSECHFQSRSCSLYSFKGTDKILKGRGVLTVTNVHMPYVGEWQKPLLHYLGASVCSYSRGKKDRQVQYLAPKKIRVTQVFGTWGSCRTTSFPTRSNTPATLVTDFTLDFLFS